MSNQVWSFYLLIYSIFFPYIVQLNADTHFLVADSSPFLLLCLEAEDQ